jgi:hypothetical protein
METEKHYINEKTKNFCEGRDYWYQYIKINGYSLYPNEEGLKKLSKNIDINIPHLRKCINTFLEA